MGKVADGKCYFLCFVFWSENTLVTPTGYHQVGDWTQELFHLGLSQPRLPLWITAAQPSLMEKSIYYDNRECLLYS